MANLRAYVEELRKTGWDCQLVIDGSFVMTAIDEPNDIDAILVLPPDWQRPLNMRPFEYNLITKKATIRDYKIEVFPVASGSVSENDFLACFSQVREEWTSRFDWAPDTRKGLIRIIP